MNLDLLVRIRDRHGAILVGAVDIDVGLAQTGENRLRRMAVGVISSTRNNCNLGINGLEERWE